MRSTPLTPLLGGQGYCEPVDSDSRFALSLSLRLMQASVAYAVTDEYGIVQPVGTVSLVWDGGYSFTSYLEASRQGNDKECSSTPAKPFVSSLLSLASTP